MPTGICLENRYESFFFFFFIRLGPILLVFGLEIPFSNEIQIFFLTYRQFPTFSRSSNIRDIKLFNHRMAKNYDIIRTTTSHTMCVIFVSHSVLTLKRRFSRASLYSGTYICRL